MPTYTEGSIQWIEQRITELFQEACQVWGRAVRDLYRSLDNVDSPESFAADDDPWEIYSWEYASGYCSHCDNPHEERVGQSYATKMRELAEETKRLKEQRKDAPECLEPTYSREELEQAGQLPLLKVTKRGCARA